VEHLYLWRLPRTFRDDVSGNADGIQVGGMESMILPEMMILVAGSRNEDELI
jgi:hypothetical protein